MRRAPEAGTEEALNAFLDGELPPEDAAALTARLAAEPELARRLHALARLKAVAAALDADVQPPPMPLPAPARAVRRPLARRARALLAVTVAGGAAAAATALLWLAPAAQPEPPAVAAHRRFAEAPPSVPVALDASAPLSPQILPRLAEAGLRLERLEPVAGGLYAGFRGPRGCRLGVWTGPPAALPDHAPAGWRVESFVVDGQGVWVAADPSMDGMRFAVLAAALRGEGGDEGASATMLAEARPTEASCRA